MGLIRTPRRRLSGLGASVYESHPEILPAAVAVAGAAGLPLTCTEEAIDNVGGRWFVRSCDPPNFPNANFDADMIAAGNVGPALEMYRGMLAQAAPTNTQPLTSFTDPYVAPAQPAAAATCEGEVGQAKTYLLSRLSAFGVGNDSRYTARLNSEFTAGLNWWLSSHPTYCGLAAHVAANADAQIRGWISELGITPPAATQPGATTPGATTPGATTPGAITPGATTPGSILDSFWKTLKIGSPAAGATGTGTTAAGGFPAVLQSVPNWAWAAAAALLVWMNARKGRR